MKLYKIPLSNDILVKTRHATQEHETKAASSIKNLKRSYSILFVIVRWVEKIRLLSQELHDRNLEF